MVRQPGHVVQALIDRACVGAALLLDDHGQEWSAVHPEGVDDTISVNEIVQHVIRTLAEDGSNTTSEVLSQAAYHTQGWLTAFINADDDEHLFAVLPHVQSLASHASRLGIATDNMAVL